MAPKVSESSHGVGYDTFTSRGFIYFIMGIKVNLIGKKFNRLTVIGESTKRPNSTSAVWICECDCKKHVFVTTHDLKTGHSKSCGCLSRELLIKRNISNATHKQKINNKTTHEYYAWIGMKTRCCNINNRDYKNYGGRGIKIYNDWLTSFESFYAYVGKSPSIKHTIDRINNNGNYEPGNVRWATKKEQANNRRNTRLFNYKGDIKTASELAEMAGICYSTMKHRLVRGWNPEIVIH